MIAMLLYLAMMQGQKVDLKNIQGAIKMCSGITGECDDGHGLSLTLAPEATGNLLLWRASELTVIVECDVHGKCTVCPDGDCVPTIVSDVQQNALPLQ